MPSNGHTEWIWENKMHDFNRINRLNENSIEYAKKEGNPRNRL
jgi:hypothetical protein